MAASVSLWPVTQAARPQRAEPPGSDSYLPEDGTVHMGAKCGLRTVQCTYQDSLNRCETMYAKLRQSLCL
jgi:hypothetical protein